VLDFKTICRYMVWRALRRYDTPRRMVKAVSFLKPLPITTKAHEYEVYFLTGARHWYKTVFCAYSFLHAAAMNVRPVIFDDGTLVDEQKDELLRVLPSCRIVESGRVEAWLDQVLPRGRFPALRSRRDELRVFRKLTDFHAGCSGWKLFLDSDMLFFRLPATLTDWLRQPRGCICMKDVETCYGYSTEHMSSLTGHSIPDRVNTGILGMHSEAIDWERFEWWARQLFEREGLKYYLDQALFAMHMSQRAYSICDATEYVVYPTRREAVRPTAIMHHYVGGSRVWYHRFAWRHVLRQQSQLANTPGEDSA